MKKLLTLIIFLCCVTMPWQLIADSGTNIGSGVATSQNSMPTGAVIMYGGTTAPTGWLLCDGTAVSRTTYAHLYSRVGDTYGPGDTTTTFNVPDMRGVFAKGFGTNGAGADYTGASGSVSLDKLQGHAHTVSNDAGLYLYANANQVTTGSGNDLVSPTSGTGSDNWDTRTIITDGANGTPRTGTITEPANVGFSYIIKY